MLRMGDRLYYVPNDHRDAEKIITLTKVGRRWLHGGGLKIDATTLRAVVKDRPSPGQAYMSRKHYVHRVQVQILWNEFRAALNASAIAIPDGIAWSSIEAAYKLLGLTPIYTDKQRAALLDARLKMRSRQQSLLKEIKVIG